jgi:N-acetyl sugar amidotransferase
MTCNNCVMDETAPNIIIDDSGICNFCKDFINNAESVYFDNDEIKNKKLNVLINQIKLNGINNKYDCIIGVSGGVDSSWVLVEAIKQGLRPLAVHMDNGWNSELAQNNIANLITKLGVDLYTYVIDWEEYRSLMQSFFDADVVDVELLYDNAMLKVNYMLARKFNVKYILSGMNQSTEGIRMPENWNWFKYDKKQIKSIGNKFNNIKTNTFPAIGTLDYCYYRFYKKIEWLPFLDFLKFEKEASLIILENEYGYKRYPYKHYESIFTRFYQGYLLPKKFKIDKRKLHLSSLIVTNQTTRHNAIEILKNSPYPSQVELENDLEYFLKKMNWTQNDLELYLSRDPKPHNQYDSEFKLWKLLFDNTNRGAFYNFIKQIFK